MFRLPKANAHADVLSRSTPGPGQYDPKRTAQGSANLTGDPSGAHTATQHGFSADRSLPGPQHPHAEAGLLPDGDCGLKMCGRVSCMPACSSKW